MIVVLLLSAAAATAPVAAAPTEQRLTPAQIQAVLDDAAAARETTEQALAATHPGPGVHGEVGVEVGSDGHRAAFGTAVVGLGGNGSAVVSFESSQDSLRRRR